MPIVLAPKFTPLIITRVFLDEKLKRRMEDLGIAVNAEVEVMSSEGGSMILRVKEGRLALDKQMATKIFVTVKEEQ
ncbi:MAG TPA: ferrous iron transport protein A [Candidatus Limadaptatus stercoripullorum]|uniref:Ferrous iron transport protein A n=1 Tax=Candidatus Limadaptatus stercoripullorum TaxID=2840846 RepID=A0A9D1SWA6_9FIRM|nr:ferrous iron transport protein A [Candidatus Limadaptatus stercoripullorum]